MKQLVYKELKRLYPNATGFSSYKTQYGTFYFVESTNGREDITGVFKEVCKQISLAELEKEVENGYNNEESTSTGSCTVATRN